MISTVRAIWTLRSSAHSSARERLEVTASLKPSLAIRMHGGAAPSLLIRSLCSTRVPVFPEAVLRKRFEDTDTNHDGRISMKEYIIWSLRDALRRTVARVRDLFMDWDADHSSSIDKREWRKAMKVLGIAAHKEDLETVFDEFDEDGSGSVTFSELDRQLRKKYPMPQDLRERDLAVSAQRLHQLRAAPSGKVGRTFSKNVFEIGAESGRSVQEQLRDALAANRTRVMDLFRDWDDDGNGLIDAKEFRQALIALGFEAPKAEVQTLFASFDKVAHPPYWNRRSPDAPLVFS